MTRRAMAPVLMALALTGCTQLVRYTGDLTDSRTGRTAFVTAPASAGGFLGFIVGVPVSIVALPITYLVYADQKATDASTADPLSTMLFPSFVLWRAGTLLGAPFDLVEYVVYRAGLPPNTMTEEERKVYEYRLDQETLPQYRVEWIYPPRRADEDGG
jgi:hypothetical protein